MVLRVATEHDAAEIAAIYAPHVCEGHASFELVAPSPSEMSARIQQTQRTHPWLVDHGPDGVLGYAYAGLHRARAAYQWSCEVSVYVRLDTHRRGVARRLYAGLFEVLVRQGYYNAYAGVTLPNDKSVAFHEAMGFTPVGVYRNIGFKQGTWRDVGWWQLELQPLATPDRAPIPFDASLLPDGD